MTAEMEKAVRIDGNKFQGSKTHCPYGHEYTPENTIKIKSTKPGHFKRQCRICKKNTARGIWKEKKKKQQAAEVCEIQSALAGDGE